MLRLALDRLPRFYRLG
ncbi:hypothetical protein [Sphingopyxis sp.]